MNRAKWILAAMWLVGCSQARIDKEPVLTLGNDAPPTPAQALPAETKLAGLESNSLPAPSPLSSTARAESAALFQRSYDSEALGKSDSALTALEGVKAIGPANYVLSLRRGWLLYRQGKHVESIASYNKAIELAPNSIEARVGLLAPLGVLRRWVDIENHTREVLKRDPGNYSASLRLAFSLYSQAKFGEAEATYRSLLGSYPSDVDVRAGLGWSLLKLGRRGEAQTAFAEVLDFAPKNALALDGLRAATGAK